MITEISLNSFDGFELGVFSGYYDHEYLGECRVFTIGFLFFSIHHYYSKVEP
jgi:hypothetical protein